ncbi:MAG: hypothetical protein ACKO96_19350, partial [Flammeovirgaceae bacterium]
SWAPKSWAKQLAEQANKREARMEWIGKKHQKGALTNTNKGQGKGTSMKGGKHAQGTVKLKCNNENESKGHTKMVVNAFWMLARGLSVDDWRWLMDMDQMLQKVYIFNDPRRSARHPDRDHLPWPVVH